MQGKFYCFSLLIQQIFLQLDWVLSTEEMVINEIDQVTDLNSNGSNRQVDKNTGYILYRKVKMCRERMTNNQVEFDWKKKAS